MRLDVYHHTAEPAPSVIPVLLARILNNQRRQEETMSEQLDRLAAEVAETREVVASAVTLIGGLAEEIRDLKDDPAALSALADDLDAQNATLAAAVAANTPATAEEPAPEPQPEPNPFF